MKPEHILWDEDKDMSLSEVNNGYWWSTAVRSECIANSDMLRPLVMFIDGVKI
jgi:hypothetical protein